MAKYELMLILNPSISEEDRTKSMDNLKKLFADNQVTIEKEDIWWEKQLAYKIKSFNKGFYVLYNLEFDGKSIASMTKTMNLDLNLMRFMFVKLDK